MAEQNKRNRKPRRIGHVGQAYLEALDLKQAEKRSQAAKAVALMAKAAA